MASTLNIDWLLGVAQKLMSEFGAVVSQADLVARLDHWIATSELGQIIYHPYISDAGERGPFVDARARASFTGLRQSHEFGDLVCAVVEGLGLAARDCYDAMGKRPNEIRLTGGAARSDKLRAIFAAALGRPVRRSMREEAGAAGAAMMAAVANGVYRDMNSCIAEWVTPHLSQAEAPDDALARAYDALMPSYRHLRCHSDLVWKHLSTKEDS
jgi:erythritol kinase